MAPSKAKGSWDESEEESTPPSSPPAVARRGKFDDEEDDSDVLESWDAAEDSEEEREKAKKAAEAKAKADAAAKASHKSKSQRIEEKRQENMRRRQQEEEDEESSDDETEADKRARLRASEKASDMKHAEELFGGAGYGNKRATAKPVTVQQGDDPVDTIDLSSLKLFNPNTVQQFANLRETLVPLFNENAKKPQYASFLQELNKQVAKDLTSDQLKKLSSTFTAMSNEKLKEEKAADKSGKKTKAAKTKATLTANRDIAHKADTTLYDDGLEDDDFM